MSHEDVQEKLLDLAYGELPRREARDLERHLGGCAECRAALARIQGTRRTMAALSPEPAPERGEGVLLAAARQEAAERHRHRPAPILPAWAWGAALGVVSVAAVVAVSFRIAALRSPPERDEEALIGRAPVPQAPAPAPPLGDAAGPPESAARPVQRPAPEPRAGVAAPSRPTADAKRSTAAPAPPPTVPSAPPAVPSSPPVVTSAPPAAPSAPAPDAAAPRAPPPTAKAPRLEAAPSAALRSRASRELSPAEHEEASGFLSPAGQGEASGHAADAIARYDRLQAAGALRSSTRATADCPGEQRRQIDRDAAGRVVRLLVEGADGRFEQFYAADGRLAAVRVTGDRSLVTLDAAAARLQRTESRQDTAAATSAGEKAPPRPPAGLIERAEDVREDAPPRCR